jgi:CRISPR-associated endoribonuclease Cas6
MKIKIELISKQAVTLKTGYNAWLQALIYNNISDKLSEKLHDEGFLYENRKFKLFTFSSILERGEFDNIKKEFKFPQMISFYISSPVDYILEDIARTMINSNSINLGSNILAVSSINVIKTILPDKNILKVNAVTPIEMHSTLIKADGKNFTHYYSPFEEDFTILIRNNLIKKWSAFYKKEIDSTFVIKPLFKNKNNEKIVFFGAGEKRTLVKGWKGYFNIESDNPELLNFALDVGLGGRNSQGFGMIEIIPTPNL